jgi:MtrB/PioB family decaheme-associated outer membrane protein
MQYVREAALALGLLLCWGDGRPLPAAAAAQAPVLGGTAYGDIELGARLFLKRPAATELARFEEYRDLREGLIVPALRGWFDTDDGRGRIELLARYPGQDDENLLLRVQRLGSFTLELERDRTPHVFTTNGRLLGTFAERGVLTLPSPRPAPAAYDAAPFLPAVSTQWKQDRAALRFAPSASLSSFVQYSRTEKRGDRPMGMAFGSPGANHREILEPIEHTVQSVRIAPALRRARYQLQATYDYSSFENALPAVLADNPLVAVDQPTAGAARGRSALAPSNQAHTVGLQGALTLPLRGRISTAMSYGWRSQTEPVLPYTSNTAINTSSLTPLPADIGGDVRTLLLRVAGSARPLRSVSVGARFRHFELDDRTPIVQLAGRVTADRSLSTAAIESHRYPYTRQTAGADVRWRISRPLALQLDYGFDEWKRDTHSREVGQTQEHTPRLTVDFTPLSWLSLHSTYLRSERRGNGYEENAASQLPLIRKHDLADRDRERLDVAAHVSPWHTVSLGASHSFGNNDYNDSRYGRSSDRNRATGLTAAWQPVDRISLDASYMSETFRVRQQSRYRLAPALLDNESYDWVSNTDDDVVTAGAGITAALIPRRLDAGVSWDRIVSTSRTLATNPATPAGGTDAQNRSATATDFPETRYEFNPIRAFVRYRLNDNWLVNASYRQERFEHVDWRSDGLLPDTGSDLFMGNDLQNYRAALLSLSVRFMPRIPGLMPLF